MTPTVFVIGAATLAVGSIAAAVWSIERLGRKARETFSQRGVAGRVVEHESGRTIVMELGYDLEDGDEVQVEDKIESKGLGRVLERAVRKWQQSVQHSEQVWVRESQVTITTFDPGLNADLNSLIGQSVDLVLALRLARDQCWAKVASEHGLQYSDLGMHGNDAEGRRFEVKQLDGGTSLRIAFLKPLPADTLIARKGLIQDAKSLDDPILGAMLDVRTEDLVAITLRLAHEDVRTPLLEILHGYPGSCMVEERFELIFGHRPLDPKPAMALAYELAQAVDRHG